MPDAKKITGAAAGLVGLLSAAAGAGYSAGKADVPICSTIRGGLALCRFPDANGSDLDAHTDGGTPGTDGVDIAAVRRSWREKHHEAPAAVSPARRAVLDGLKAARESAKARLPSK